MAYITPDRVLEGSITTGAGNFTLAGNVIGFRAFAAVSSIGDLLPYYIEAVDTVGVPSGEFEVGLGRYSAANTLERVTVYASSNAGALVNFAAGQKIVGVGVPGWDAMTRSSRVGEVVYVAAITPKAGTLELNNATISRATYPNLWAWAQTSGLLAVDATDKTANPAKFGRGDGSTTFQLPDLRDRALIARGVTFPFGTTGGSKDAIVVAHSHTGAVTGDGAHTHTVPCGAESAGSSGPQFRRTDNNNSTLDIPGGAHAHGLTINSTGASGTNANMQPYAALLACIYY
jgi:microcystin-dependent protein